MPRIIEPIEVRLAKASKLGGALILNLQNALKNLDGSKFSTELAKARKLDEVLGDLWEESYGSPDERQIQQKIDVASIALKPYLTVDSGDFNEIKQINKELSSIMRTLDDLHLVLGSKDSTKINLHLVEAEAALELLVRLIEDLDMRDLPSGNPLTSIWEQISEDMEGMREELFDELNIARRVLYKLSR